MVPRNRTTPSAAAAPRRRGLALVTGASVGIGRAFAERLARDGYDLLLVARRRAPLEELAKRLGELHAVETEVLTADLTQPQELRVVEERAASEDRLELLVNNAGFGTSGRFAELDPDREEAEIRLNVIALARLTRAALPGLIARGRGGIVLVSSVAAFAPGPFTATYSATKAYVLAFGEALAEELRGTGVRIQVLCPGFTRTEFQQRAGIDASQIPRFAWMTPEAVVAASLRGLERGELVCVPGLGNRVLAALARISPHAVTRRIGRVLFERNLD